MSADLVAQALRDPEFQALPFEEKRHAMASLDPEFDALGEHEQRASMNALGVGVLPKTTPIRDFVKSAATITPSGVAHAILPMAGMAAAAALAPETAGASLLALPVLGGAAGEAAATGLDEAMGTKTSMQMSEVPAEVGKDLTVGAAGAVGNRMAELIPELGVAAKDAVKTGLQKVQAAAERLGIQLTPGQLTKNSFVNFVESVLKKFPLTAGTMKEATAAQAHAADHVAGSILEDLGTVASRQEQGQGIQQGIMAQMSKDAAAKDVAYKKVAEIAQKSGGKVEMTAYDAMKAELLAKRAAVPVGQLPDQAGEATIRRFLGPNPLEVPPVPEAGAPLEASDVWAKRVMTPPAPGTTKMPPTGLMALRENLNGLIGRVADTPEKQVYKQLKGALDEDFASFVDGQGGKLQSAYKLANQLHGEFKTLYKSPDIQRLIKASPEDVVDTLLKKGDVTGLNLLRKATDPAVWEKHVQPSIVNRLFAAPGLSPEDIAANYPAGRLGVVLQRNMKYYGGKTFEEALPKETIARLTEFVKVMDQISVPPDVLAGNASGSGSAMSSAMLSGYLLHESIHDPVTGMMSALNMPVLANLWLSDTGRDLIKEGLNTSARQLTAKQIAITTSALTALRKLGAIEPAPGDSQELPSQADAAAAPMPGTPPAPTPPPAGPYRPPSFEKEAPADLAAVKGLPLDKQIYRHALRALASHDLQKADELAAQALKENPNNGDAKRMRERIQMKRGQR